MLQYVTVIIPYNTVVANKTLLWYSGALWGHHRVLLYYNHCDATIWHCNVITGNYYGIFGHWCYNKALWWHIKTQVMHKMILKQDIVMIKIDHAKGSLWWHSRVLYWHNWALWCYNMTLWCYNRFLWGHSRVWLSSSRRQWYHNRILL